MTDLHDLPANTDFIQITTRLRAIALVTQITQPALAEFGWQTQKLGTNVEAESSPIGHALS